ncbi:hypothetical protein CLOBOL_02214 [Enterocloster bolteae ATCC BAA-613]|uniref:Uncharacterized protein n=1 Tax=Enterocloster bolteae (strain ATCC BAA-613 / DSM 15670 / CCUG 46953 / JCM 12243 / WAL 16351) TaxID=411902 RepID=A8RNI9_ENTBW|nr:hypothetical protein CLOBOL_02214 [Enterocloster bolteae ATCC BAA-613]
MSMDCQTENRGFQKGLAGRGTSSRRVSDRQFLLERERRRRWARTYM